MAQIKYAYILHITWNGSGDMPYNSVKITSKIPIYILKNI